MPALPSWTIDPIWDQCQVLIPPHEDHHPLGCHRPRIPDRLVFDKLVQVLVFGCAYQRIADATVSATTLRRRRDVWIAAGVMDHPLALALAAYDRMIGLALNDVVVDGCITTAPCGGEVAGRSPVDRGKQGRKRSTVVDANGIPLGAIAAPANRHDSPLLEPTLDTARELCASGATVHLDRGYASTVTRDRLATRGLVGEIAPKGTPAPIAASSRWPVERTHAWTNAHTRNKIAFTLERTDAIAVANGSGLSPEDFTQLPPYAIYASLLSGGRQTGWFSGRTLPPPQAIADPDAIRRESQTRYGADPTEPMQQPSGPTFATPTADPDDEPIGRTPRGGS